MKTREECLWNKTRRCTSIGAVVISQTPIVLIAYFMVLSLCLIVASSCLLFIMYSEQCPLKR
jgi:hypothetical protein